jgi:hypothetical protein
MHMTGARSRSGDTAGAWRRPFGRTCPGNTTKVLLYAYATETYASRRFRLGKGKAITATAGKLPVLVYRFLKGEITYKDPGVSIYDLRYRESSFRRLRQKVDALGFTLLDRQTGQLMEDPAS